MSTLIARLTIADGGTVSIIAPDDGGVQIELHPFSSAGATPAVAVLNLENAERCAGLIRSCIGYQHTRKHEQTA